MKINVDVSQSKIDEAASKEIKTLNKKIRSLEQKLKREQQKNQEVDTILRARDSIKTLAEELKWSFLED